MDSERLRLKSIIELLPRNRRSVLEIGARDGFITRALVPNFETVIALDLKLPSWSMERVAPAQGDVQHLDFSDKSFDCVVCTEVLEHVQDPVAAARELLRVARHEILIGVPYRQDLRVGRLTCVSCGTVNPPYGHVNSFDESRLKSLFAPLPFTKVDYVAETSERTNFLAAWFDDIGGHRYGDYSQQEACISCGGTLVRPSSSSLFQRACAAAGVRLFQLQQTFNRPQPAWIHCLFRKVE